MKTNVLYKPPSVWKSILQNGEWGKYALCFFSTLLLLFLSACGGNAPSDTPAQEPATPVNGFGTALNHPHSMLAFPNKVVLLATHYGLFYSNDEAKTWTMVAAGPGQLMDGLMTYSLTSSTLNPQRVYVLTDPAVSGAKGTLGLYSSQDQGKTWKLAISKADLTSDNRVYLAAAGNDTPDEVYVYLQALGALGLKVSMDAGEHFTTTGTLPFGSVGALLAIPSAPGKLLVGDLSDGMARSSDGGLHWEKIEGVSGGIYSIVTAGPNKPIYAAGDSGVYASNDGGKSFKLVYTGASYTSFSVSPTQPQVLYGLTGTGVYHSTDGGHTWSALPHLKGNLYGLTADPNNASQVYLSISYPTELYRFNQADNAWASLTPKT